MLKRMNFDYTIITILFAFGVISTMLIYSATSGTKYEGMHVDHLVTYAVFFVLMLVCSLFDYKGILYPLVYILYAVGIVLQVLVLFIGDEHLGARRWIDLGFVQFQPSELMKILLVMAIARFMARREGAPLDFVRDVVPILLMTLLPFVLIMRQPDLGTSLVFIAIFIGMVWIGNIRKKHVLLMGLCLVGCVLVVASLYFINYELFSKIIRPHQMERIQTFLNPDADPENAYHVNNAKRAISVGQLAGAGWNNGYHVQRSLVPFTYSDSIFVVVGEEFGFIGSAVLLLLYFMLIYRMIYIALECQDLFSRYLIVGVATMMSFQTFVNIGMHLGLLPLTGVPLPFMSYGRTSLLLNIISVGLVLSIRNNELARKS